MMRRIATAAAILLGAASLASSNWSAFAAQPPNVVIFIADDLSWHDVGCFGGPTDAKTPNLDSLAAAGIKLTGFYSPASVCSPTRQSLLTGLYPVRSGAYPNHSVVKNGVRSLPNYLKPLGYSTACFGKTHFGPSASYPFDLIVGTVNQAGQSAAAAKGGAGEEDDDGDLDFIALKKFVSAAGKQPFCAYIAPHEPHAPWTKGDSALYDPSTLKVPPYLVDTPQMRTTLSAYYAEVSYLDSEVGAVIKILEESGVSSNTLFLFCSEQGSGVPHAKWTLYDPGIRVAAIVRWPGRVKPASESSALIQYVDVVPTILAAAGLDYRQSDTGCPDAFGKRGFDGQSFLDVLLGNSNRGREMVFAQHTTRGIIQGSEAYASRSVFNGQWKLILNLHATESFHNGIVDGPLMKSWKAKGQSGDKFAAEQFERYQHRPEVELYDLHRDPWELSNVADDPANSPTVLSLRASLAEWMKQQGDKGDQTEREATDHQAGNRSTAKSQKAVFP